MIKILFVCMGNICRSPSAEGFFTKALEQSPLKDRVSTDSAGTHGYHVGHSPDPRAVKTAADFGVDISALRARKVSETDFDEFDLVIAMDSSNVTDLERIMPANSRASLRKMLDFHPDGKVRDVPDPYYGGMDGFTYMCELLESASQGLLDDIGRRLGQ